MKNIVSLVSIIFTAGMEAKELDKDKFCSHVGMMAKMTMESRQHGMDMEKTMSFVKSAPGGLDKLTYMVIEAYESPLYRAEENKKIAITEFKNKHYLACTKSMMKKE